MRYHLFQKLFRKMVEIKETSFLSTRGMILIFGNCIRLADKSNLGISYKVAEVFPTILNMKCWLIRLTTANKLTIMLHLYQMDVGLHLHK